MRLIVLKSLLIFVTLCFLSACHKVNETPANTVSIASSSPSLRANTALTAITHITTGATGIGPATGLPAGVTAIWAHNIITISGTPTASGTFSYSIPLTGGSGAVFATGMITVTIAHDSNHDFMPLNVGAKYLYSYYGRLSYPGIFSSEEGECQWEFIESDPTPSHDYRVRQILNGIHISKYDSSPLKGDTTLIRNRIDTLTFKENDNGTVTITFPVMYWGSGSMTVERYMESSKIDTCFIKNYISEICLSKIIGIKSLSHRVGANHSTLTSYSLVKGPY